MQLSSRDSNILPSNKVVPILGFIYFQDPNNILKSKIPTVHSDEIKGSLSIGMILGQLLFGVFGDAIGRHRVYGKELLITICK